MLLDHVFAFSTFDRVFTLYLARSAYCFLKWSLCLGHIVAAWRVEVTAIL